MVQSGKGHNTKVFGFFFPHKGNSYVYVCIYNIFVCIEYDEYIRVISLNKIKQTRSFFFLKKYDRNETVVN